MHIKPTLYTLGQNQEPLPPPAPINFQFTGATRQEHTRRHFYNETPLSAYYKKRPLSREIAHYVGERERDKIAQSDDELRAGHAGFKARARDRIARV